jgi:hypothetical protein
MDSREIVILSSAEPPLDRILGEKKQIKTQNNFHKTSIITSLSPSSVSNRVGDRVSNDLQDQSHFSLVVLDPKTWLSKKRFCHCSYPLPTSCVP